MHGHAHGHGALTNAALGNDGKTWEDLGHPGPYDVEKIDIESPQIMRGQEKPEDHRYLNVSANLCELLHVRFKNLVYRCVPQKKRLLGQKRS